MLAVYALRMQLNKIRLVPVCLALSTVWSLAGQSTTTRVAVVVTDQEGAVVAHAQVRFAGGPNPFGETATDNLGQLTVELTPGSYTLSVSNQVFERYTRQVEVLPVKEEQIFPVVLKVLDLGGVMVSTAGLELISKNHAQVVFEPSDIKTLQHIPVIAHNPHTDADETYSGVRLADLLAKIGAPLGSALHGKALANYIVATGSDGYQAVLAGRSRSLISPWRSHCGRHHERQAARCTLGTVQAGGHRGQTTGALGKKPGQHRVEIGAVVV